VFGVRAGIAAAEFASNQSDYTFDMAYESVTEESHLKNRFFKEKKDQERIADIRNEMHKAMEQGCGIYRTENSLLASQKILTGLKERMSNVTIDDKSRTFNTELVAALELSNMLDLAESIVQSALNRKESRGSHQRIDYEKRDDENYLNHSLAYKEENNKPRIEYLPVTITKWPPGERVYGK